MKNNKMYKDKYIDKMFKAITLFLIGFTAYQNYNKNDLPNLLITMISVLVFVNYVTKRDYYLPFLGDAVIPTGLLVPHFPEDASVTKQIRVKPRQKVIFWASEPSKNTAQMPWEAYKKYQNAGVSIANENGIATIRIRKPSSYTKPWGYGDSVLKKHFHYRVVRTNGMLGRVETVYI